MYIIAPRGYLALIIVLPTTMQLQRACKKLQGTTTSLPHSDHKEGPHDVPGDGRILQEVLQQLLHRGSPADKPQQCIWTPACEQASQHLKRFLASLWFGHLHSRPFHLQIDASGMGTGAVLLQVDPLSGFSTLSLTTPVS